MSEFALFLNLNDECVVCLLQEAAGSLDGAQGEAILDFSCVRVTDQMHLRCPTPIGAFPAYRKNFPESAFEAVERDVG